MYTTIEKKVLLRKPIIIAGYKVYSINPEAKSSNFLNSILAGIHAEKKYFESIMCNLDGYIAEGAVSNIFIMKNGVLKTPSVKCGILPGITREVVIKLARKNGISVSETLLKPGQLFYSDECFLTNSSIEIMPVRCIGKKKIKKGSWVLVTRVLDDNVWEDIKSGKLTGYSMAGYARAS